MKSIHYAAAALAMVPAVACAGEKAPQAPSATAVPLASPAQVASPKIVMLRLYVSDIARSERFYHDVLAANVIQRMGEHVRIMMFSGGAMPGIILIQSPEVATMHGSFVIQVPILKDTLALAAANGGTLKNTHFEQNMAGTPAQSSHFADPDGNLIEVLQMGGSQGPAKP